VLLCLPRPHQANMSQAMVVSQGLIASCRRSYSFIGQKKRTTLEECVGGKEAPKSILTSVHQSGFQRTIPPRATRLFSFLFHHAVLSFSSCKLHRRTPPQSSKAKRAILNCATSSSPPSFSYSRRPRQDWIRGIPAGGCSLGFIMRYC
jgi:hypothetical protein